MCNSLKCFGGQVHGSGAGHQTSYVRKLMSLLLATAPIVFSSVLILLWRQSALRAGLAGLLVTVLIVCFRADFQLPLSEAAAALGDGLLNTLNVAYVLLGGVLFYRVLSAGGALEVIADAVIKWIPDEIHRLFAIVFGVSVFFESATGFGVGILVAAPLFIALGYKPVQAAIIALLGQCAVPWGALAIGTVIGSELSGVPMERLGELAAFIGFPFILICGAAAVSVAGQRWQLRHMFWLVFYALIVCALLWVFSVSLSVELAGCLAGLAVVVVAAVINWRQRDACNAEGLGYSLLPFATLMILLLLTRLVTPLRDYLQSMVVRIGEHTFTPLFHVGFWLLVASLLGLIVLPKARQQLVSLTKTALVQWSVASAAVGGFLLFGHLMTASGMTALMAQSLAATVGNYYPMVVPVLGGLGGFLTASNTSSNALFMNFQMSAAAQVNMPVDVAAAVQNAAGSNTTLASPGRVVFAASVAGYPGAEADLLRRVLPVALAGVASAVAMSVLLSYS